MTRKSVASVFNPNKPSRLFYPCKMNAFFDNFGGGVVYFYSYNFKKKFCGVVCSGLHCCLSRFYGTLGSDGLNLKLVLRGYFNTIRDDMMSSATMYCRANKVA